MSNIAPCLWFDNQAEEAAKYYVSIFKTGRIARTSYYLEDSQHGPAKAGDVLAVEFEVNGQSFSALNGGPHFKFNEAISLQVMCKTQEEIEHYWSKLGADGDPNARQCGWLKDKYGVSWQLAPDALGEMLVDKDKTKVKRVFDAMMQMKKMDIAALHRAYAG
jgi:predicted 3-demethylubiquinone-9 3-methyltransferase (glyoxalase superfamily)